MVGGEATADGLGCQQLVLYLVLWNGFVADSLGTAFAQVESCLWKEKSSQPSGGHARLFESEYGSWTQFGYSKEKGQVLFTSLQVCIITISLLLMLTYKRTLQSFAASQAYREPPEASGKLPEKMLSSMSNLNTNFVQIRSDV
jgi:hypothetical protein